MATHREERTASKIETRPGGDGNLPEEDLPMHIYIYMMSINSKTFSKIIIIVQLSKQIAQDDETGEYQTDNR